MPRSGSASINVRAISAAPSTFEAGCDGNDSMCATMRFIASLTSRCISEASGSRG